MYILYICMCVHVLIYEMDWSEMDSCLVFHWGFLFLQSCVITNEDHQWCVCGSLMTWSCVSHLTLDQLPEWLAPKLWSKMGRRVVKCGSMFAPCISNFPCLAKALAPFPDRWMIWPVSGEGKKNGCEHFKVLRHENMESLRSFEASQTTKIGPKY